MLWYQINKTPRCSYRCEAIGYLGSKRALCLLDILRATSIPRYDFNKLIDWNAYILKNELGNPHFLSLKSDEQAKMKLSAKLEKNSLERIQSNLKIFELWREWNLTQYFGFSEDNLFPRSQRKMRSFN